MGGVSKSGWISIILGTTLAIHIGMDLMASRLSVSGFISKTLSISPQSTACEDGATPISHASELLTRDEVAAAVARFRHDLTYVRSIDAVFATMGKAGSTTTWRMLYLGLTGTEWDNRACGLVHNKSEACWAPYVKRVKLLSPEEQWRVMTSEHVLRVAIQREPFERLISAFKNKLACNAHDFNTEIRGERMHVLRRQAALPTGVGCMNVSEYAFVLDRIRKNVGKPGFLRSLDSIDEHFRPQNFEAGNFSYNLVLDVSDLSDFTKSAPFVDLLPFADRVKQSEAHLLDSGESPVVMDDVSARRLHEFALLAEILAVRYRN